MADGSPEDQEKLYTQADLDFFSGNADEYFEMANALRAERDRYREALLQIKRTPLIGVARRLAMEALARERTGA